MYSRATSLCIIVLIYRHILIVTNRYYQLGMAFDSSFELIEIAAMFLKTVFFFSEKRSLAMSIELVRLLLSGIAVVWGQQTQTRTIYQR